MNDLPEKTMEHGADNAERPKERPRILPLPPPPPFSSFLPRAESEGTEPPDFVPFRPPRREHFMPWLALLSSQKIPYRVEFEGAEPLILIPWDYVEKAEREFSIYEARHANWPRRKRRRRRKKRPRRGHWSATRRSVSFCCFSRCCSAFICLSAEVWMA